MKTDRTYFTGLLCVAVYVAMSSLREIFFASVLHRVSVFVLVAIAFSLATTFFALTQMGRVTLRDRTILRESLGDVLAINLTTAVMWFAFILALRSLEPAVVTSLNSALGPVVTLFFSFLLLPKFTAPRREWIAAFGVLVSLLYLMYVAVNGSVAAWGIFCCVISGSVTAVNNIIAKRLSLAGLSPSLIMAIRFFGLVMASIAWLLLVEPQPFPGHHLVLEIAAISFFGIIIPLYLLQVGIARTDISSVALIVALGPLVTWLFQRLLGRYPFSWHVFAGIVAAMSFVLWNITLKARGKRV